MELPRALKKTLLLPSGADPSPTKDDQVWRLGLLLLAGGAALGVISRVPVQGAWALLLFALIGTWSWVMAVRLLFLDTRLRIVWLVVLGGCAVALLVSGPNVAGFIIAIVFTLFFLLFHTYRPYRHLTGSRRARFALLAFLLLFFIPWSSGLGQPDGWVGGTLYRTAAYSGWALRTFLLFSLVHIFVKMRLHFLRLRPKLVVGGMFIALVPLVLFATFALIFMVVMVGGHRAERGAATLQSWVVGAPDQPFPMPLQGGGGFEAWAEEGNIRVDGARPGWLEPLVEAVRRPLPLPDSLEVLHSARTMRDVLRTEGGVQVEFGSEEQELEEFVSALEEFRSIRWAPADTSAVFRFGEELWALRMEGIGEEVLHLWAAPLGSPALGRLADLIDASILLTGDTYAWGENGAPRDTLRQVDGDTALAGMALRVRADSEVETGTDTEVSFWGRPFPIGIATLDVIRLRFGRLQTEGIGLVVERSPAAFLAEFTRPDGDMLRGLFGVLIVIAGLFLMVEFASFFLGLRITSGFTSAVRALHAGTRRLAQGDLDTRIELPNLDEFGDLATAFNDMAVAVKKGREEAIERERLEKELETAREIQERLLPRAMPVLSGFDIAATSVPSKQVGGDYFDFVQLADNRLGVAIGDVSGKGIPAALLMANLQAALQGQAIHPSTVAETVARVNDLLVRSSEVNMYATFFYGVLDGKNGSFLFCNAGHNPTLLMNSNGESDWLSEGGIVIGMMSGQPYEEGRVVIQPGDVLVLYTDGITEAAGPDGADGGGGAADASTRTIPASSRQVGHADDDDEEGYEPEDEEEYEDEDDWDVAEEPNMFEEERLVEVVGRHAGRTAREIRDAVLGAVSEHTAGTPQSDDITLVVIKRTG